MADVLIQGKRERERQSLPSLSLPLSEKECNERRKREE